jgi:hypothetical protein
MPYWRGSQFDLQSRRALEASGGVLPYSALLLYLAPRQFAVAISDSSIGNWTTEANSSSNLYASIDETVPDNTDYIRSGLVPSSDVAVFALTSLSTPLSGPQYLRYRYGKDVAGGQVNLTVELLESGVSIQTWTHTNIAAGFLDVTQPISVSITNYGALSVRLTATQV